MSKGTFGFSSAKWPETAGKGADRSLARALQACLMSPAEATASRAVSLSRRNRDADSGVLALRTATSPAHPGVNFSSLLVFNDCTDGTGPGVIPQAVSTLFFGTGFLAVLELPSH